MFEQGRAGLDLTIPLRKALCPNGDTVQYRERPLHVAAWAKQFLFRPEHLDQLVGDLSGGERARSHCPAHAPARQPSAAR